MTLIGRLVLNLLPTAFYIRTCKKYNAYWGRLLKEDFTSDDDGYRNYIELKKGKIYTTTHYMLPELIFIDDAYSKENRLKQLKKEISKLENDND